MTWVPGNLQKPAEPGLGWVVGNVENETGSSIRDRWGMSESVGSNEEIGIFSSNLIDAAQAGAVDVAEGLGQIGTNFFDDISRDDMTAWANDMQKKLEYEPTFTWERVKKDWDEGGLGKIGESVAGFILEQGARSAAPMAMTLNPVTFGAYIGSLIGSIGAERSRNDGREDTQIADFAAAIPYAAASAFLERWGTNRLLKGRQGAERVPTWGGAAKEVGERAVTEAGQEAVQESVQYLGEAAGTKAGVDLEEMALDRALAGAIAGGGMGATVGGAVGVSRRLTRPTSEDVDRDMVQARKDAEEIPEPPPAADTAAVEPEQVQAQAEQTSPAEAAQPSVEDQADALVAQAEAEEVLADAAQRRQAAAQPPGVETDAELRQRLRAAADQQAAIEAAGQVPTTPEAEAALARERDMAAAEPVTVAEAEPIPVAETVVEPELAVEVPAEVTTPVPSPEPAPPKRPYNEAQKEVSRLNKELKKYGLKFPEGKRTAATIEPLIVQAKDQLAEAEQQRAATVAAERERDAQATLEPFRAEAVASIQNPRETGYAASELLLRQTSRALKSAKGRKLTALTGVDKTLDDTIAQVRAASERRTEPEIASAIFDAVNELAPTLSTLTGGQVKIQDAKTYPEAVNAALTALDAYLPKREQGKARVLTAPKPKAEAVVEPPKQKAKRTAASTSTEPVSLQALAFALSNAHRAPLRTAAMDVRDTIEGVLEDKSVRLIETERDELINASRLLNVEERQGKPVLGEENVKAIRQRKKVGAPQLRSNLGRVQASVSKVMQSRRRRMIEAETKQTAQDEARVQAEEDQIKRTTEPPPVDPTMPEADTGQPFAQRLPEKPAAELRNRLTDVFNTPGLDGSGFVSELLRVTQGYGRNDNVRRLRMLARVMASMNLSHVTVQMDPDLGVRGDYDHRADLVRLNPVILQDPERALQTALHEMVHAATVKQLHENNAAAKRLHELQRYVDDVLRPTHYIGPKYGAADVYEFIAEGLVNPAFQAQLNDILLPTRLRRGSRLQSVWDAFVDIVRKALGLEPRAHSALDAFLGDASTLLTDQELQAGRDHYYLRRTGYMPQADMDPRTGVRRGFRQVGRAAEIGTDDPNILGRTYAHGRRADWKSTKRDWKHWVQQKSTVAASRGATTNDLLKIFAKDFRDPDPDNPGRARTYLYDIVYNIRARTGVFRARQADKSVLMRAIEESLANNKAKTEDMFGMAHRATMAGLHPDKVWSAQAAMPKGHIAGREALHKELHQQWKDMDPKLKKLYRRIVAGLKKDLNDRRAYMMVYAAKTHKISNEGLLAKIGAAKVPSDLSALGLNKKIEESLQETLAQFSVEVPGVYFPLRRFGDYTVSATKEIKEAFATEAEAADRIDAIRKEFPGVQLYGPNERKDGRWHVQGKIPYLETAESQAQAEDIAADMRRRLGTDDVRVGTKRDVELPVNTPLKRLLEIAEADTRDPEMVAAMRNTLLSLLPESRQLRSALTRQYVEGYSKDMFRSLAQHFMAGDRAIAGLAHSHEIAEGFRNAVRHADRVEKEHDADRSIRMREVISELRQRSTAEEDVDTQPWARYVGQIAFLRFLTDARYLVMNLAQPWMTALPELGGVYGVRQTAKAMERAYRITMPRAWNHAKDTKTKTLVGNLPGLDPSTFITELKSDIESRDPNSDYLELINVAQNQGVLSSLQAEEMAAIGYGETRLDNFARLMAGPSQYVEFMNRLVVLISAYELEKRNNTKAEARLKAVDRVRDTQIDYSTTNRPRFIRQGLWRVWGTFKMFAFGMYSRLIEYTARALKGKSKAEKQKGAKQLGLFLGVHTMAAGALGGLIVEPIRMAIYAAGLVFDDEDDFREIWDNPDLWTREVLNDTFGPEVGRWAATGIMPTSMGQSMGLGGLLFMQLPDTSDSAVDLTNQLTQGVFGAPGRIVFDAAEGIRALNEEGDFNRFLAKTIPLKAATNLVKANRLSKEGIIDRQGNQLITEDDVGWGEVLLQSLGVSPSVVSEVYAARDVKYSREKPATDRAKLLRKNYYNSKGKDRVEAWKAIQAFNRQNPAHRITYASLRKGLQRRRLQERETRRGVYFHGDDLQRYYNPQTSFAQVP